MNTFDKIIGYDEIKGDLFRFCDMLKNADVYKKMGAKMAKGVLLYGDPGLGKSLMCECFIDEVKLPTYTVRNNTSEEKLIENIQKAFESARENAPAIVYLDDMDKFANEDYGHPDAEPYVVIQSCIDEVKNSEVFVLATANNIRKLPSSLIRSGRFDRVIRFESPDRETSKKIIEYYLKDKNLSSEVDIEDLSRMFSYNSCAELESMINTAAIDAAYKRKESIDLDSIVKTVLFKHYGSSSEFFGYNSIEDIRPIALHEAGHLVVAEIMNPGCVGLASIQADKQAGGRGYIQLCDDLKRRMHRILTALAGKAAVELYYCESVASGCQEDIEKAFNDIRDGIVCSGTRGLSMVDVSIEKISDMSESMNSRSEAVAQAELERCFYKAKDILLKNRTFLEAITDELVNKKTLLYSDIQRIKANCNIVEVSAY